MIDKSLIQLKLFIKLNAEHSKLQNISMFIYTALLFFSFSFFKHTISLWQYKHKKHPGTVLANFNSNLSSGP